MNQYRVTKYNPAYRDKSGEYLLDEWTDISDIGMTFSGVVFTEEEYRKVENNYVKMCIDVWEKSGCPDISVQNLEKHSDDIAIPKHIKAKEQLEFVIRKILATDIWAKLECETLFFHFGYDFNMYIGTDTDKASLEEYAQNNCLFVEELKSPYLT